MTIEHLESHIVVDSEQARAVDLLQQSTGLSRQRIKLAMTSGAVWLTTGRNTRRLRRATRTLRTGDQIHLYYDREILAQVPPEPDLVADSGAYSVWCKPRGLRSQGSKWGDHCTLERQVERKLKPQRPVFTVHRLDRAAKGLMLIAHSKTMAAQLSALFQNREIEKRYQAQVNGDFSAQANPLRVVNPVDGREAISEFSLQNVSGDGRRSLLEVSIETGRKHQIRRHLAGLGFPITGDRLYGTGKEDGVDLQLVAFMLAFRCPVIHKLIRYELGAGDGLVNNGQCQGLKFHLGGRSGK